MAAPPQRPRHGAHRESTEGTSRRRVWLAVAVAVAVVVVIALMVLYGGGGGGGAGGGGY